MLKPIEEDVPAGTVDGLKSTFEESQKRGQTIAQAIRRTSQLHGLRRSVVYRVLEQAGAMPAPRSAESFQINGEWVIRLECRECRATIHLPCEDAEPSAFALKLARATVHFCNECSDRREAAEGASEDRRKLDGLIVASAMPAAVQGMTFADMSRDGGRRDRAIEACDAWARGELERPGIYLFGAPGVGKTRLAATTAWARMNLMDAKGFAGRPIRWCSVVELMTNLNRVFSDRERQKALNVLTGTDALVLDDLDKVNPSEFGKQQIFAALDARVTAGTPLLVTANARLSEIGERYGDHVMSRLAGHCLVFELDGDDRRLSLDVDGKSS